MTLSALSGSVAGGLTLGLAHTFGMVFPLFVMALVWDRYRLGERRFLTAKPVTLRTAGHTLHTNTINVGVAAAFAVMGGFVLYLAGTGTIDQRARLSRSASGEPSRACSPRSRHGWPPCPSRCWGWPCSPSPPSTSSPP